MTKEELKKEAEEYASMYARQYLHNDGSGLTNSYCEVYNAYYQSAEPREKRIAELEKENAELKKQLEMSNKVYNDNLDYSHHIERQLTKAKKLLERLLITSCNSDVLNLLPNCSEVLKVRVEAEQFLKE